MLFLLSDLARAMTGEILHVDGGFHAMGTALERGPRARGGARVKPTVFLTGATGFLGMEVLARLLEEGDRDVLALIRASDDAAAERRLDDVLAKLWDDPAPYRDRVTAVRGDVTAPGLGLGDRRDELAERTGAVLHCAASISFDLPLAEARAINVDGTARVLDFAVDAQARDGLERFLHVSTAYVAGRYEGTFRERQLDAGQTFRNTYEETKADAEQIVTLARELGPAIARPSIVVGESDSGWTPAFNVLYWPLRAFSRGMFKEVPALADGHVDVVPIDYVADALVHLLGRREAGVFNLVSGRNAPQVDELVNLASDYFGKPHPEARRAGRAGARRRRPGRRLRALLRHARRLRRHARPLRARPGGHRGADPARLLRQAHGVRRGRALGQERRQPRGGASPRGRARLRRRGRSLERAILSVYLAPVRGFFPPGALESPTSELDPWPVEMSGSPSPSHARTASAGTTRRISPSGTTRTASRCSKYCRWCRKHTGHRETR